MLRINQDLVRLDLVIAVKFPLATYKYSGVN